MKKFFVVLALFIFIGCGGSESEDFSESEDCTTIDSNMWSPKSSNRMIWDDAVSYCNNLTACGYYDWRLPNINELRTLIQNCPGSQTGGACAVSDPDHLSSDDWSGSYCSCDNRENNDGYYSKLGDDNHVYLWSSSVRSDITDDAWRVYFRYGNVSLNFKTKLNYVRCVR